MKRIPLMALGLGLVACSPEASSQPEQAPKKTEKTGEESPAIIPMVMPVRPSSETQDQNTAAKPTEPKIPALTQTPQEEVLSAQQKVDMVIACSGLRSNEGPVEKTYKSTRYRLTLVDDLFEVFVIPESPYDDHDYIAYYIDVGANGVEEPDDGTGLQPNQISYQQALADAQEAFC